MVHWFTAMHASCAEGWRRAMVALTYTLLWPTRWLCRRYVTTELAFHHSVVTWVWYPFVVQQVRHMEHTDLRGVGKRDAVVDAVQARFVAKGLEMPLVRDVHLAIEYAVRDHAH